MREITIERWKKIPREYKGRNRAGERTWMTADEFGCTTLLTEGKHFKIVKSQTS